MSITNLTKKLLADSLKSLSKKKAVYSITVKEIVEHAGVSKQTFYNHFGNRKELLIWIIKNDLSYILETVSVKVFERKNVAHPEEQPLFIPYNFPERENAVWNYWNMLYEVVRDNKNLYLSAFSDSSADNLVTFMLDLFSTHFKKEILLHPNSKHLNSSEIDFLARYFSSASIGSFIQYHILAGKSETSVYPPIFKTISHDCLMYVLNELATDQNVAPDKKK